MDLLYFLVVITSISACMFYEVTKLLILSFIDVLENREVEKMSKVDLSGFKAEYGINQVKAEEGVWKKLALLPGVEVCVRRQGNKEYQKYLRKHLYKPFQRQFREGTVEQEIMDAVITKATCKYILVDWRGFKDGEGNDVPFSYEEAHAILSNPELEPLKNEIIEISQNDEYFRIEEIKAAEKNSVTT